MMAEVAERASLLPRLLPCRKISQLASAPTESELLSRLSLSKLRPAPPDPLIEGRKLARA